MKEKLIGAVAIAATLVTTMAPAFAAPTVKTGTVVVSWNTQAAAVLTLFTNYTAAGVEGAGNPTITTATNGGTGTCTATGNGAESAGPPPTVNFGNVTPDTANTTDCNYQSAINAQVVTSSKNWSLTEAIQGSIPAGYGLCAFANNATKSFPFPAAGALAATASQFSGAAPATATVGTCTAGAVTGAALSTTAFNVISAASNSFTAATPANLGEDLELQVPANAAAGANTATIIYTLTAN